MNPGINFMDPTPQRLQEVRHGADFYLLYHIFFEFQSIKNVTKIVKITSSQILDPNLILICKLKS